MTNFKRLCCVTAFSLFLLLYYTPSLVEKTLVHYDGSSDTLSIGIRAQQAVSVTRQLAMDITPDVVMPSFVDTHNETFDCKTAVLMNMSFPVCLYSSNTDTVVTKLLLRGVYYEGDNVKRFLRLLRLDRRLQLVDIGANLGLFSLPAARLAQVLAVEPNWRNMLRLAKAVDLGAVSSNVTLIHNAISNVRATLNMGVHPRNQGHAFLINTTRCKQTLINTPCNTLPPIRTILLNDILRLMRSKKALMKVDIESHEVHIFTEWSAGQFFDHIDVSLVFMEWNLCKKHPVYVVQRLLNFFYTRNYTVFSVNNSELKKSLLKKEYYRWPGNVLFKKNTSIDF